MKKSIFIALFFILALNVKTNAQIVNIPDSNFKAALVNNVLINTNSDFEIQISEAESIMYGLDVAGSGISDLTGIEAFINLTLLDCSDNFLTNLDLTSNTRLQILYCSENLLTDLNLTSNNQIGFVECSHNQIQNLNFSYT